MKQPYLKGHCKIQSKIDRAQIDYPAIGPIRAWLCRATSNQAGGW